MSNSLETVKRLSVGDIVYLVAKGQQAIAPDQFAAICRLACEAVDMTALLRDIYEEIGPGSRGGFKKEPMDTFAQMTTEEVDETWDYQHRHLAHRIAKLLCQRP